MRQHKGQIQTLDGDTLVSDVTFEIDEKTGRGAFRLERGDRGKMLRPTSYRLVLTDGRSTAFILAGTQSLNTGVCGFVFNGELE